MARQNRTDPFAALSPEERAHFGPAEEWELAGYSPPRARTDEMRQFSLRVPTADLRALRDLAEQRGVRFSVVVRDAIENYVGSSSSTSAPNALRISVRSVSAVFPRPPLQVDRQTYADAPAGVRQDSTAVTA
jgi:hypothetical protein